MKITRRQETRVSSWREDAKVVKTRNRIAELDQLIHESEERLLQHQNAVAGAEAALERAEVEVLGGRQSDAHLAKAQQAHLEARIARSKVVMAFEDMQAERDKLTQALPGIEKQAKQAAQTAYQAKGAVLLKEMLAAIETLADAEAHYGAVQQEAEMDFPLGINEGRHPEHDPDMSPRAGLGIFSRSQINQGRREHITLEGSTEQFQRDIAEILAYLEAK